MSTTPKCFMPMNRGAVGHLLLWPLTEQETGLFPLCLSLLSAEDCLGREHGKARAEPVCSLGHGWLEEHQGLHMHAVTGACVRTWQGRGRSCRAMGITDLEKEGDDIFLKILLCTQMGSTTASPAANCGPAWTLNERGRWDLDSGSYLTGDVFVQNFCYMKPRKTD